MEIGSCRCMTCKIIMIHEMNHIMALSAYLEEKGIAPFKEKDNPSKKDIDSKLSELAEKCDFTSLPQETQTKIAESIQKKSWDYKLCDLKYLYKFKRPLTFFKVAAYTLPEVVQLKNLKRPFTYDIEDKSILYLPEFEKNSFKNIDSILIQKVFMHFEKEIIYVNTKTAVPFTDEIRDFFKCIMLGISQLPKTEPPEACFLNKWANKLFSYWTYKYVLIKELKIDTLKYPVEKFRSKRQPSNETLKNLLYLFVNLEPSNLSLMEYIASSLTGKIKMKSYNYIHDEDFSLFNYKEIMTTYNIKTIPAIKTTFGIKDTTRETINFFKKKVNHILNQKDFAEWNSEAQKLIKSNYFLYYKRRIVLARKLRTNKDFKLKDFINRKPNHLISNLSFESFIRKNDLKKEYIEDILDKINEDDLSQLDEFPDSLVALGPMKIREFLISLNAERRRNIRTKSPVIKEWLDIITNGDETEFKKLVKAYQENLKKKVKE